MRCRKCGAELPDGARFCYMCASPVEPEEGRKGAAPATAAEPAADGGAAGEAVAAGEAATGSADVADAGAAAPAVDASSDAHRASQIPAPTKLEDPLPIGAVPFVPMAPSPRSTYVQRRGPRPVRASRPGANSAPTSVSGYSTSGWPQNSAWSLEGRMPEDTERMIERRNESDDPIGSARNKLGQVFSSWTAASAERGEKKRKEREVREAARRVEEQHREDERLAAERAWRERQEKERLAAERAWKEQQEEKERREHELAELRIASEGVGERADSAQEPAAAQADPEVAVAEGVVAGAAADATPDVAEVGAAEVTGEATEAPACADTAAQCDDVDEADESNEADASAAAVPVADAAAVGDVVEPAAIEGSGKDGEFPAAAFPAQPDAQASAPEPGPSFQEEPANDFDTETTRDLGAVARRLKQQQQQQQEAASFGKVLIPSASRLRRHSQMPVPAAGVVAGVIAGVLVIALVVVALSGVGQKTEKPSPAPAQQSQTQAEPEQEQPEQPAEPELAARQAVEDYSWDELSQISQKIAAASSDTEGLEIAKKYNLVSAAGTLDGTQAKTLQLSDGTSVKMRIAGFRQDERADGSGKAGITLIADSTVGERAVSDSGNADWGSSTLRSWLNDEFASELPDEAASKIVEVNKTTTRATDMSSQETTADKVWIISYSELVGTLDSGSYRYSIYTPEGAQYKLFADLGCTWGANSEHYKVAGGIGRWWLRSPDPLDASCHIAPNNENGAPGYARNCAVSSGVGVVPAFCL